MRMSDLLALTVSTRGQQSWSLRVLEVFLAQFATRYADAEVCMRDLNAVPHISLDALQAGRTPVDQHTAQQRQDFALQAELVDEVAACQHLVIATPMYNWGPPSALKAWVDHFVNIRTFYGSPSPFAGKQITVIVSSAGLYSRGELMDDDGLRPWLRIVFRRLGSSDVHFIDCDPTGPLDRGTVQLEDPASAWAQAMRQVTDRIAELSA